MFRFVNEDKLLQQKVVYRQTLLHDYGFTERLIQRYLPKPVLDATYTQRKICNVVTYFWSVDDIMQLKCNDAFIADYISTQKRKIERTQRTVKETNKYKEQVQDGMNSIIVVNLPYAMVVNKAIRNTDAWKTGLGNMCTLDQKTKDMWTLRYILHNLTVYDTFVNSLTSKVDKQAVLTEYTVKTLDAIAQTYPQLKALCEKEKNEWQQQQKKHR